MSSLLLNTLYTPLDWYGPPPVDSAKLEAWMTEHNIKLKKIREYMSMGSKSGESTLGVNYPWAPVSAFNRNFEGWQGNFDRQFPELASYFLNTFGILLDDIDGISILPVKPDYTGRFWHQDPDEFGLRINLEYEDISNKLILKKTIKAYTEQEAISARYFQPPAVPPDINQFLKEEIHTCQHSPTGCYYINNIRAAHTIDVVTPGKKCITVIVYHNKTKPVIDKITDLVASSLEKYVDYAITY
jgi:hypothetical protein